jgi:hypothetical protein
MFSEASLQINKIKNQRIEIKGVSRKAAKHAKKSTGPELSVLSICAFSAVVEDRFSGTYALISTLASITKFSDSCLPSGAQRCP